MLPFPYILIGGQISERGDDNDDDNNDNNVEARSNDSIQIANLTLEIEILIEL
jgi:hypothetical protein